MIGQKKIGSFQEIPVLHKFFWDCVQLYKKGSPKISIEQVYMFWKTHLKINQTKSHRNPLRSIVDFLKMKPPGPKGFSAILRLYTHTMLIHLYITHIFLGQPTCALRKHLALTLHKTQLFVNQLENVGTLRRVLHIMYTTQCTNHVQFICKAMWRNGFPGTKTNVATTFLFDVREVDIFFPLHYLYINIS